jgi:hypothetical protein
MLIITLLALFGALSTEPSHSCPSVLMFDGVKITKDLNEDKAKYWGQQIGIDGFFLNYVVSSWQDVVPDSEATPEYLNLRQFQQAYSKFGVTQNFIKTAIYKPVNWQDPAEIAKYVDNFRRAAKMAKFAGIRGIALDLEPYVKGFWEVDPANPSKGDIIYKAGLAIGNAIEEGYPRSPIFIIREVLWWQNRAVQYALAGRFWDGLMASSVPHFYVGEELTYDMPSVPSELRDMYRINAMHNHHDPAKVEIAPALWPLGHSYADKSPRVSLDAFRNGLQNVFADHPHYVWIYGFGSAWETGGAYGPQPVASNFQDYVSALRTAKQQCGQDR